MGAYSRVRAFAVHVLTAVGAALALLALIFATGGHWAAMFLCLGLALIVDALDGPLAREFDIARVLPRWNGEALDLVVDYTAYVFVPAYAIVASGLLPEATAVLAGIIVVVCGALYFADRDMKTVDFHFRGFPAVWNVPAFYLYVLQPPAWVAFAAIVVLALLSFARVRFVHPFRVRRWRTVTLAMLAAWVVCAGAAVIANLSPDLWVKAGLSITAIYFLAVGALMPKDRPA
jgi:phosphatidylcholine synthase